MMLLQFSSSPRHRLVGTTLAIALLLGGCDLLVSPQTRYERAQSHVEQGDYRRALVELKNALDKQPDLRDARVLLAEVALWLGDAASAEVELDRAQPLAPEQENALRIRVDLALGRLDEALQRLEGDTTGIAPAEVQLYRAQALQGQGQNEQALAAFQDASEQDPQLLAAQVGIIETLTALGQRERAAELAAAMVQAHPQAAMSWYAQGMLQARQGQTAQARQSLERAHELADGQLEVMKQSGLLSTLIEVQLTLGEVQAARASLQAMERVVGGTPLASLMAARVAMAEDDYLAAASGLRRLVNAAPQFVQARYLLGVALVAQGNLEQASQELTRVLAQEPQNLEARQLLAQVRLRLQDADGAMQVLVPAIEAGAGDPRLSALLEDARAQAGSGQDMIDMLERALERTPGNRGLTLQLATAYLQADAPDKAAQLLRDLPGPAADARKQALLLQAITQAQGPAAARRQIDALVAEHGEDALVQAMAAAFYSRLGELPKAREVLTAALRQQPEDPQLLFSLAQLELKAGNPQAARTALQSALQAEPQNMAAQLLLVEAHLAASDVAAATALLETMQRQHPQAVQPPLLLARLALAGDDTEGAQRLIAQALEVSGGRGDVLNTAGLLYLQSGRLDQARDLFRQGTERDAGDAQAWMNLGRAQFALGQLGAARQSLQQALKLRADWLAAEGTLTFVELQDGDAQAALQRVTRLKEQHPGSAPVLMLEGEVLAAMQRYPAAVQAFEAAAGMQPTAQLAVRIYQARRAGGLEQPADSLARWVSAHPQDVRVRAMLADAYLAGNEPRQAAEQYRQIVQQVPRHVPALNNLAWIYHELGDNRALSTARRAHELAPQAAATLDTLGWILVEAGQVPEGLALLGQAVQRPEATADIRYHHAVALARSGDRAQAVDELQRLLAEHETFAARAQAEQALNEMRGQAAP